MRHPQQVEIFLANQDQWVRNFARDDWSDFDPIAGDYDLAGAFYTDETGEQAAEEAFDISGNPSRVNERFLVQGRSRTLSVGDYVRITYTQDDGFQACESFLCLPYGWREFR